MATAITCVFIAVMFWLTLAYTLKFDMAVFNMNLWQYLHSLSYNHRINRRLPKEMLSWPKSWFVQLCMSVCVRMHCSQSLSPKDLADHYNGTYFEGPNNTMVLEIPAWAAFEEV